jgi:ribonuclease D
VDTEADSLHAYPEKVCLIQISTPAGDELIDPLAGLSLDLFLDSLGGHELIMHGSDYDLRLLRKHHEFVPGAIFDTMLAARLLGLRQFSLTHLVATYLDAKLEKGPQKANWAMRPLTERMERYARNDTHFLKPLADRLKADLWEKGRLAWHQEFCARLITECAQDNAPDPDLVWRVKGAHLLGRPALAMLRELWRWREREATAANRPPFFVLSHQLLVDIAAAAATQSAIQPLLPRHLSERRRDGINRAIAHASALPEEQHPKILRHTSRRPSEAERRRFLELQTRRDARATELEIDPTLIASRALLADLAQDGEVTAAQLMPWQRQLLLPA